MVRGVIGDGQGFAPQGLAAAPGELAAEIPRGSRISALNSARSLRYRRIDALHWLARAGAGDSGQYPSGKGGETYPPIG